MQCAAVSYQFADSSDQCPTAEALLAEPSVSQVDEPFELLHSCGHPADNPSPNLELAGDVGVLSARHGARAVDDGGGQRAEHVLVSRSLETEGKTQDLLRGSRHRDGEATRHAATTAPRRRRRRRRLPPPKSSFHPWRSSRGYFYRRIRSGTRSLRAQRAPALRQPAARCCGFPERLCADSHDKCPTKLNTAAKRAKNCPKASGWNSQKCAATCGTGSEAAAREDDV